MPAVQTQFEDFHASIKLAEDDEKAKLRDKRDTLVKALKANLEDDVPSFESFNQGSYSMHTGVMPLDGNYDIDVGLIFDCQRDKYPDPVVLKRKVRDALNSNGRTVAIRRPCVTVNYVRDGKTDYHVDLAIYAKRDDDLLDLAKGKENSTDEFKVWDASDPKKLTTVICEAFKDSDELAQYRRCIRYIKRWRNVQFRNGGAPLSIALTVAAKEWFSPRFAISGKPTDLLALLDWVKAILARFEMHHTEDDGWHERLKVTLPVTPYSDLMAWMTKGQMATFKEKLEGLRDTLNDAYDEDLPEDACKLLNKQFGDDFKIPEKAATAKAVAAPVISTGSSA
ncbi:MULTISPECIES: nucleotidyltransferase [unclassified Cupriavidus]|uniref:nucleotidyltransferase domain-containing protein n=1 Tax=unclassified Cupriavidus TaxID=2640874 RepID=UPI001AE3F6D2|nr:MULTISPECIES: nucleotidyltransferase [unclassified Cupriavidus]MBP0633182.1 nucleotidyltransferase [Cupriavidus sp. AcVe19-1a]MBP0639643.1 nucleotidyltransferase [Cupriavidus sp. AcVe19-6a]